MKKILLALTLVFGLSSSAFAANTETEPNDTIATADILEVNSSISGQAGTVILIILFL
ncbi:acid shock protein [Brevibacillus sp. AG]|uniref:acid shock protein n=1 Tax=Brevibacillus sp. AG TaxID=3020891 RepID=UPI00232CA8CB|nr:acid shock protein [Brevibacillus sp. AG]MDC0763186.1 acid shock protein [Brevibacillus sp. AG]